MATNLPKQTLLTDTKSKVKLSFSYREGHLDLVRYFVTEADCDPNVIDADQTTPLHTACRCIKYFL